MERYLNFAHQTETKNRLKTEKICKIVFDEFANAIDLKINFRSTHTYLHIITTLLLSFEHTQHKELLLQILRQNNVDERGLLLHLLSVINQFEPTLTFDTDRHNWITSFSTIPLHQDIVWDNEKIKLYNHYKNEKEDLLKKYERMYGPITTNSDSLNTTPWAWDNMPWPWDN